MITKKLSDRVRERERERVGELVTGVNASKAVSKS